MGLDWGMSLRNKTTKKELSLVSFRGWNTKELLAEVKALGTTKQLKTQAISQNRLK